MRFVIEFLGLQTPRARLAFFAVASVLISLTPVRILAHLSLWKHLGIQAPSIGLTRAYHYLLHGDIAAAWHQNRLIFMVIAVGLPLLTKDVHSLVMRSKQKRLSDD